MNIANSIAQRLYRQLEVCEYGIRILPEYNKTWKEILRESKK